MLLRLRGKMNAVRLNGTIPLGTAKHASEAAAMSVWLEFRRLIGRRRQSVSLAGRPD